MRSWKYCVVPALLSACGMAIGQSLQAYTVAQGAFSEDLSVAPAIAVGPSTVVIAGSHSLRLYDKGVAVGASGFLLDDRWQSAFPFTPRHVPSGAVAMSLVFPRADYDPISDRTWMMFSEIGAIATELLEHSGGVVCAPYAHLAVSSDASGDIASFSGPDWHSYTGSTLDFEAFDLGSDDLNPYSPSSDHVPLVSNAMATSLGFDERAIFVVASDRGPCAPGDATLGTNPAIVVIPREHDGGAESILDGDRPSESDMLIARMAALPETDDAGTMLAVQEPYEQYPNVTLFISTDGTTAAGIIMNGIRLRGIYNEEPDPGEPAGDWLIRQSLKLNSAGTDIVLADMDVRNDFPHLKISPPPIYQHQTFPVAPDGFRPNTHTDAFASAVLTEDNQGNPRVFAVHASRDHTSTAFGWVVQWYIIDPKVDDFFTLLPEQDTTWNPEIVHAGRIETDGAAQPVDGDCYLPTLAVSRTGQVYIEYTFSSDLVGPKVLRAVLNNSYSDVASTTVVEDSSATGYGGTITWGLYPDMQADPFGCFFWSTHTLVDTQTARAAWLMKTPFACFQTDLNADETTDPYDLAIYQGLYLDGHRRADTDADGEVGPTDMAEFSAAYDAATGP